MRFFFAVWFGGFLTAAISAAPAASYVPALITPPRPAREYRAAWVATVANVDWPSKGGLPTAQQKAELVAIMDRAARLGLNTIIFQVRPGCDAIYPSSIEPWSEYLTGVMGKAPDPFYDPLAFAIEEAHKRGLELHAWFNPYRARHANAKSPIAPSHISRTHPELVRHYGKSLWLDPGEPEVQAYSLKVVMDVVRRYDVDGVHFDDYFYPYKELSAAGEEMDFPDDASWKKYGAGGRLDRDDWRRENVNTFINRVYKSIKAEKPWVKFGISPFGIWRPGNPPQIKGFDAYATLYADSRKWLANGWLDYFVPQLYWAIQPPDQSFPVLLKWWSQQNTKKRLLLAGLDATKTLGRLRTGDSVSPSTVGARWGTEEILDQVRITRKEPGVCGQVLWNMRTLMYNSGLDSALERQVFSEPALAPAAPWLDPAAPAKPELAIRAGPSGSFEASWNCAAAAKVWLWVVQTRAAREWKTEILPGWKSSCTFAGPGPEVIAVTAVSRCGAASKPVVVTRVTGRRGAEPLRR